MDIKKSTVTKLTITGTDGLDPVNVILEDFNEGQGRLWIECYGDSWAFYWGSMDWETIAEFITTANTEYIVRKMVRDPISVTDYNRIAKEAGIDDELNESTLLFYSDEISEKYGGDWHHYLPTRESSESKYLTRIIDAVRSALKDTYQLPKAA